MSTDISRSSIHSTLPLPSNIRQIDGLQVLRTIAVILVVWLHAGQVFYVTGSYELPSLGAFGIDIFFVISGFIVCSVVLRLQKPAGTAAMWDFLKRRLIRIFPIYWIFALLVAVRLLLRHALFAYSYLPALLLLPSPSYPRFAYLLNVSWTLIFEMYFYYLLSFVLLWTVRHAVPVSIALFCGAIILGSAIDMRRPILIIVGNPMILEFVAGAVLALAYTKWGKQRRLGIAMFLTGWTSAVLWRYLSLPSATGMFDVMTRRGVGLRVGTYGASAFLIVGGMIFINGEFKTRLGRTAVIVGNASYSIYLASSVVLEYSARLLLKLFKLSTPLPATQLIVLQTVGTVLALALGWACYQWIEWPVLRALQRRFLSRPGH